MLLVDHDALRRPVVGRLVAALDEVLVGDDGDGTEVPRGPDLFVEDGERGVEVGRRRPQALVADMAPEVGRDDAENRQRRKLIDGF